MLYDDHFQEKFPEESLSNSLSKFWKGFYRGDTFIAGKFKSKGLIVYTSVWDVKKKAFYCNCSSLKNPCAHGIDLYFRFGTGAISNAEIKEFVKLKGSGWYQNIKNKIYGPPIGKIKNAASKKIIVFNDNDEVLEYSMAKCCNPIPGEEIVGYVTRGRGVTIHRNSCKNLPVLDTEDRFIDVDWNVSKNQHFLVLLEAGRTKTFDSKLIFFF